MDRYLKSLNNDCLDFLEDNEIYHEDFDGDLTSFRFEILQTIARNSEIEHFDRDLADAFRLRPTGREFFHHFGFWIQECYKYPDEWPFYHIAKNYVSRSSRD